MLKKIKNIESLKKKCYHIDILYWCRGELMKYKFTFKLDAPLELPINYNHVMQASLIAWLNNEQYQKFLHDCGYEYENRTFKMYS